MLKKLTLDRICMTMLYFEKERWLIARSMKGGVLKGIETFCIPQLSNIHDLLATILMRCTPSRWSGAISSTTRLSLHTELIEVHEVLQQHFQPLIVGPSDVSKYLLHFVCPCKLVLLLWRRISPLLWLEGGCLETSVGHLLIFHLVLKHHKPVYVKWIRMYLVNRLEVP